MKLERRWGVLFVACFGCCCSVFETKSQCTALSGLKCAMWIRLASNSQRSACLCLSSAGSKMCATIHAHCEEEILKED